MLVSGVQQSDSVISIYLFVYLSIYLSFQILSNYRLLQDIKHSSLRYNSRSLSFILHVFLVVDNRNPSQHAFNIKESISWYN